ncbi:MAG: glycoside hydrolase family 127 protein [Sphingobacteriales bacterium]|nr:glycoside hydrolase family 127 protein [Sphingobacteriales bacterium]
MLFKRSGISLFFFLLSTLTYTATAQVKDKFHPLASGAIKLNGYLEDDIERSIANWNLGVVPYDSLALLFKNGRSFMAQGEMWGKAVRSGCMFYRYNRDPRLKVVLKKAINELLSYKRGNGSISCTKEEAQPDGPGGDIWERKYVMLGLEGYYTEVEADTSILNTLVQQADILLSQVGPSPKTRIVDLGWSPNHIESSTVLEPIMRLYNLTGYARYLDFARYIVETEGGAKGENIIESAYQGKDPATMGGVYPKAYEMMSLFEGVLEYYRVTQNKKWLTAALNLFEKIKQKEITIIGNGGGDLPYHPDVMGEAWDYTALEQTNPDIKRMMETCAGVTWMKLCSQILRLTGEESAVDMIEQYAYNGLLGAMKPEGDGFSYVNLLNGVKTNTTGWGGKINGVDITCCNLNGPMGLAYIPYIAVMQSSGGPVINLFNSSSSSMTLPSGGRLQMEIESAFPRSGLVKIRVGVEKKEAFPIQVRIPQWSGNTVVIVDGREYMPLPGRYMEIKRLWKNGDSILVKLDMRCKVLNAPKGSNRQGDNYQALTVGPIVLARDENIDSNYNQPVKIISGNGIVAVKPYKPTGYRLSYQVPTSKGYIRMVDYASVNNWNSGHVCTWLPTLEAQAPADYSSTLIATDALGRKLPGYKEVGEPRNNKFVGLFYWTWHTRPGRENPPFNVTEYLARDPKAIDDYNNPIWPRRNSPWFWGEPLLGYYLDTDEWVLRKHAEMLADAGVDVIIFDCTNGNITWKESYTKLCEVFTKARKDGVHAPQIAFMLPFWLSDGGKEILREIYTDLYRPGKYKDLWFIWKGKPLVMGMPEFADDIAGRQNDPALREEMKSFFTFRPGQPAYNIGPARPDHWGWLEIYPQHGFGKNISAGFEQVTVGVAQNWSKERGLTAMNAPGAFGRSYTHEKGQITEPGAVNKGYNFQEQWNRALELDPEFIFITGWNEWVAGRYDVWQQQTNAFPDECNEEGSRDVEPMKGGHGDNYYYQMVSNIRRFKGMPAPQPVSAPLTVQIDGKFPEWNAVTPAFASYGGNTLHRNSPGWGSLHYTNNTGRNDIVLAKVARDKDNLYFYVETAAPLTPKTDRGWMRLFIDVDNNKNTGWEGYDFVVNRINPGKKAVLERTDGSWYWQRAGELDYAVEGNKMEIKIPRSLLGINGEIDLGFKWSDNMQQEGEITDWIINGDVAPAGRFNFHFTTK